MVLIAASRGIARFDIFSGPVQTSFMGERPSWMVLGVPNSCEIRASIRPTINSRAVLAKDSSPPKSLAAFVSVPVLVFMASLERQSVARLFGYNIEAERYIQQ